MSYKTYPFIFPLFLFYFLNSLCEITSMWFVAVFLHFLVLNVFPFLREFVEQSLYFLL